MQKTSVADIWTWKRWQPDRSMDFNSWFVKGGEINIVVDPLEPDADDLKQIEEMGGVAWIVITNRDHERATKTFVDRFEAKVAASGLDADELSVSVTQRLGPEEIFHGWRVIELDGFKTPGEIALLSSSRRTVILGDSLWGDPAGSLRFMPDAKLQDPRAAVLSMRRVRAVWPENVLVGDGVSIYGGGREVLGRCIDSRGLVEAMCVNLDEVPLRESDGPSNYQCRDGEIGLFLGAEKLGYRIAHLEPGKSFCPMHWHTNEEELFIVWAGEPTLQTPRGNLKLRRGDCVAFPTSELGAHKILNEGSTMASIVMIAANSSTEACFYPESRKVLIDPVGLIVKSEPALGYYDGE
jgi:uncharacterized cupin superfamily protein/glyoxylase-like metal-dependent hydrolase (beta-lactamase superfamily II)